MSIKLDLKTIDSAANIQMLKITGNFEEGYITPFGEEFIGFVRGPAVQLILDIEGAKGITGSGITELINARNQIIERGGKVVLMGVKSRIQTMIEVSGLEKYFPIVSTESEAVQLFDVLRDSANEVNDVALKNGKVVYGEVMSDKKNEEVKQNLKKTDLDETLPSNFGTGGLAGKSTPEAINLAEEEAYWKEKNKTRTYNNEGREYDEYATAFHYGWEAAAKPENADKKFEDIEAELEREWPSYKRSNKNSWRHAKDAIRNAYDRIRVLKMNSTLKT